MSAPYGSTALRYHTAGWHPLPLPWGQKDPVPTGYTGHDGHPPTLETVTMWATKPALGKASGNVALVMPDDVIGIDVDHYDNKHGMSDLAELEEEHGKLPPTFISTARYHEGHGAGIRFYRVPAGRKWKAALGNSIEILQRVHRYAVVSPSIHRDLGTPYAWVQEWENDYPPELLPREFIPYVSDLPDLPEAWVEFLTEQETYEKPTERVDFTSQEAEGILTGGQPCLAVLGALDKYALRKQTQARHESMTPTVYSLVRLGEQGHEGVASALAGLRRVFLEDTQINGATDRKRIGDFQRSVDSAIGRVLGSPTPEEDKGCCGTSTPSGEDFTYDPETGEVIDVRPLNLPVSFYESRPELKEIRDFAHRWAAPADPVLYAILARVSASLPPGQRVQTGILSPIGASPNLFIAAIGPSGSCKSSASTIAKSYFTPDVDDMLDGITLGSGEGLAEAYMGTVEVPNDNGGKAKTKKERRQVRENLFIVMDEGEALTKQMDRNGTIVGSALRSAADGKELGQANAEEARNRHVGEGKYSLGMLIGFQPETAAPLLRDSRSGTTQRFIYCSTTSKDIPDTPPPEEVERPDRPSHFAAPAGDIRLWSFPGVRMSMAISIKQEIYRDHIAHMKGEVDEDRLNARKNLTKAKLAGLLTLLNDPRRQVVTQEEWDMAETMWQISCNVRDHYRARALETDKKDRDKSDTAYAMRQGKAEMAKMEARDGYVTKAVIRCAKLIAKHVNDGAAKTVSQCKQKLSGDDRHLAEEAIDYAVSVLWLKVDGTSVMPGEAEPK